ncbi:MAG: hypothetical protein A2289_02995 [Deltaproteobacteria bacterium RIFOXYA12_FULL_58_15]|nr:MAG: hypothetical protein A2289_02995 [Deltaproteobacteria bacterium RIFOXYA12_FULL_58_15]OGR13211.1 MAG: hypothetical protein A2341_15410 [Deltaproteobacteria bacterium RIFOXYB12_FULL_58_9]
MSTTNESDGAPILPIAVALANDLRSCADELGELTERTTGLGQDSYLEELAATQVASDPRVATARVAIVAQTHAELTRRQQLLAMAIRGNHDLGFLRSQGVYTLMGGPPPRVAAIFPGQGMQYPNMLREAASYFPKLEETLSRIDLAYQELTGRDLRPTFWVDDVESYVEQDEDIPCALFAVNIALFEVLGQYGCRFDAVMGQSIADISALVASGLLSIEEGLEVVWQRNQALMALPCIDRGRMISVMCTAEMAEELTSHLGGYAVIAAYNCPTAYILSVSTKVVDSLLERCRKIGVRAVPIPISHAYHSKLIAGATDRYRRTVDALSFRPLQCDLVSSITGHSMQVLEHQVVRNDLVRQLVDPIHVQKAIETLYENDVRIFIECGPRSALTTYVNEALADQPHIAQPTLHPQVGELEYLFRAIACLFTHGIGQLTW